MPHPDGNQPIPYEARRGERYIEIILNARDAPVPGVIDLANGVPAQRMGIWAVPKDWKPVPGETRMFVDATEEWAHEHADRIAGLLWESESVQELYDGRLEDLQAVLLRGLLDEVARGAPMLVFMEKEESDEAGPDRDLPGQVGDPDDVGF